MAAGTVAVVAKAGVAGAAIGTDIDSVAATFAITSIKLPQNLHFTVLPLHSAGMFKVRLQPGQVDWTTSIGGFQTGNVGRRWDGLLPFRRYCISELFHLRPDFLTHSAGVAANFASIDFQVSSMTDLAAAWIKPHDTILSSPVRSATAAS